MGAAKLPFGVSNFVTQIIEKKVKVCLSLGKNNLLLCTCMCNICMENEGF